MPTRQQAPLNEFLWRNAPSVNLGGGEGSNTTSPYFETGGQIYDYRNPSQGMTQDQAGASILGGATPDDYLRGRYGDQYGSGVRYDPATGMVDYMQDTSFSLLNEFGPLLTLGGMAFGANGLSGALGSGAGAGMASVNTGAAGAMGGAVQGGLSLADTLGGAWGLGGADAAWGVNQAVGDYSNLYDTWGADSGANWGETLRDLSPLGPATNLQDMMTQLDRTSAGRQLLNSLTGGVTDAAGTASLLQNLGLSNRDMVNMGGRGLAAVLQALSSNQQSNAMTGLADRYSAQGAPSRARFEASMTPGFDPMSIPGYQGALDTASESLLARLSAQGGNPFGNPQGLIQANKQIVNGTALPAINEYQRLNLGAGGLANLNAAIPSLQTGAIGQDANVLAALGAGIGGLTAPDNSLASILRQLRGAGLEFNNGAGL